MDDSSGPLDDSLSCGDNVDRKGAVYSLLCALEEMQDINIINKFVCYQVYV